MKTEGVSMCETDKSKLENMIALPEPWVSVWESEPARLILAPQQLDHCRSIDAHERSQVLHMPMSRNTRTIVRDIRHVKREHEIAVFSGMTASRAPNIAFETKQKKMLETSPIRLHVLTILPTKGEVSQQEQFLSEYNERDFVVYRQQCGDVEGKQCIDKFLEVICRSHHCVYLCFGAACCTDIAYGHVRSKQCD